MDGEYLRSLCFYASLFLPLFFSLCDSLCVSLCLNLVILAMVPYTTSFLLLVGCKYFLPKNYSDRTPTRRLSVQCTWMKTIKYCRYHSDAMSVLCCCWCTLIHIVCVLAHFVSTVRGDTMNDNCLSCVFANSLSSMLKCRLKRLMQQHQKQIALPYF